MPELPEVETVVRDLRGPLVGRTVHSLWVGPKLLRRAWDSSWNRDIVGRTVRSVDRRGKWIRIDLGGPLLLVHLGMTGQLTLATCQTPRVEHTHVVFTLDRGEDELRFRDVRRFGSISLLPSQGDLDAFFCAQKLGPEPFELDADYWRRTLAKARRNLKAILLDQRVVAGVGNIYADESLHVAGLHPARLGVQLRRAHADALRRAVAEVLRHAIAKRGSTIRDYIGGSGLKGGYQDEFRVYGRTGLPCRRCRTPIERMVVAGRSSHFCPKCQRIPRSRTGPG
jgi:formamidopyrimidine-DNA glycosylase